jgi:hypothetical protein
MIVGAAVALLGTSLFAASPAEASYRVIKWKTTQICEVWDYNISKPWPKDYVVLSKKLKTWNAAWKVGKRAKCWM